MSKLKSKLNAMPEKNTLIIIWGFIIIYLALFFSQYTFVREYYNCMINDYLGFAKSMAYGKVLYTDLYDHKGLFLYLPYILAYYIDRTGTGGVVVLDAIAGLLFSLASYKYALLYCSKTKASVVALLSLLCMRAFFHNIPYWNTDFLAGVIFIELCRYIESGDYKKYSKKYYAFVGLLFAMLLWSKYVMVFVIFPIWLYIFISSCKTKEFLKFFKGNLVAFATICGFSAIMLSYFIYHNNVKEMVNTYILSTGGMKVSLIPDRIYGIESSVIVCLFFAFVFFLLTMSKRNKHSWLWLLCGVVFIYVFCVLRNIMNLYTVALTAYLIPIYLSKIDKKSIYIGLVSFVAAGSIFEIFISTGNEYVTTDIIEEVGNDVVDCYITSEDIGIGKYVDACPITKKYQWWPAGIPYASNPDMWNARKSYLENQTFKYAITSEDFVSVINNEYVKMEDELIRKNYTLIMTSANLMVYQSNNSLAAEE